MTESQLCNLFALISIIIIVSFVIGYLLGKVV
jgi:hypothetical protein